MSRAALSTTGGIALCILIGLLVYPGWLSSLIPTYLLNEISSREATTAASATTTIYFTGDIMLARHVESLMLRHGSEYPYRNLSWLTDTPAYIVGNFESALPAVHSKSPTGTFRFSTDLTHLPALKAAGFTHLSLANNHALDYGAADFEHMKTVLAEHDLTSFGHPTTVSTSSVTYISVGDATVAIIGLHTLFNAPVPEDLTALMGEATKGSDMQIAYIHWGIEYDHLPSPAQRALATELITQGVDLIIGHHPHVTQAVELISGVPVFYSLGNFIFDQYFSAAVQDGLVIRLEKGSDGYTSTLVPVTSRDGQAQPRQMTDAERTIYLAELAEWSSPELASALEAGQLTLPHSLATLTETAIMGE